MHCFYCRFLAVLLIRRKFKRTAKFAVFPPRLVRTKSGNFRLAAQFEMADELLLGKFLRRYPKKQTGGSRAGCRFGMRRLFLRKRTKRGAEVVYE